MIKNIQTCSSMNNYVVDILFLYFVVTMSTSVDWDIAEVIGENLDEPRWAMNNVVRLFEEDNSIPFIARYRKEQTNNMTAEKLRQVKEHYDELKYDSCYGYQALS